ncbi:MAG: response regulator transcription factor [Planctomycetes bacterium]|nr:response regulator transcription factor [Planctomycetota bacterium]
MRVVIADDSFLLREGLARLLAEAGIEVVASVGDGDALEAAVEQQRPEVALVDIRMPPTFTHEGAQTALRLRAAHPDLGILLLSQVIENRYALELAREHPARFGYLLKDRVLDVATLVDSVQRVADGGTVLDPDIVAHFLGRQVVRDRLTDLTNREREVLALMAEGRSNGAIAARLVLSDKTVETHIASIFGKLELIPEPRDHRRVLAVLAWLQA